MDHDSAPAPDHDDRSQDQVEGTPPTAEELRRAELDRRLATERTLATHTADVVGQLRGLAAARTKKPG
jgi:hypothetical protein